MGPSNFKVCVRCFTYNQSALIQDALDGFAMQETTFPYVCCIVDDASTDGQQKILLNYLEDYFEPCEYNDSQWETEYASIHYVRHKTNRNCYFAVLLLKTNIYRQGSLKFKYISQWRDKCKYEAMCEGDDFWVHPEKLQIQVDYLDSHPDCGMCYSNFNILIQNSGELLKDMAGSFPKRFPMTYDSLDAFILNEGYVCPPSWLYTIEAFEDSSTINGSCDGTFVLFTNFLAKHNAHYIPIILATYRILDESASHSADTAKKLSRIKGILKLQLQLADKYGLSEETKRQCTIRYYRNNLRFLMTNGLDNDVQQAYVALDKKLLKEKLEFALYQSRTGRAVMGLFFSLEKKLFKLIPSKTSKF